MKCSGIYKCTYFPVATILQVLFKGEEFKTTVLYNFVDTLVTNEGTSNFLLH